QVTASEQCDGDNITITTTNGVPDKPSSSLLRARSTMDYDDRGRVYRTRVFSVDQSSGTVSTNSLATNTWYDHRGQAIKTSEPGGVVTKRTFDGAGRTTKTYSSDGGGDSAWSDAATLTSDNVLTQTENQYDADGNVLLVTTRARFHDETTTGALGDPSTAP